MDLNRISARLNRIYWWLEKRIDPLTRNSQLLYAERLRAQLSSGCRWLDMGCGRNVLPEWIPGQADLIAIAELAVGCDYTMESIEGNKQLACVIGDVASAPFKEGSFDIVSSNMVVEHLEKPSEALRDIYRLLRPGGRFVYHTPNIRFYMIFVSSLLPQRVKNLIIRYADGRDDKDVFPTRYRMNDFRSIYETAEACGFRVAECHSVNSSSTSDIILLGPFVVITLFIRRLLQLDVLQQFRSNFVVVLAKPVLNQSSCASSNS